MLRRRLRSGPIGGPARATGRATGSPDTLEPAPSAAIQIAVVGAGEKVSADTLSLAEAVGRQIALCGAALVCGGLGGVMEAAARGAKSAGGHTIGILPGYDRARANPFIEFVIPTGMGQARNVIVVACSRAVVALPGEAGTLSEVALALKLGRPVVALSAWGNVAGVFQADSPADAVTLACELTTGNRPSRR